MEDTECAELKEKSTLSQLTISRPPSPPPPRLRSGHLDIKDAQCAKNMMGV